jgi:hypothetical protein
MVPYLVFFAVACVVSLFTLGQKGKLLVDKFRQRQAASGNAVESVETLEEKLIANKMEIRKIYCLLLLGATEGARCDFRMFDAKTNRVHAAAPMFSNVPAAGLCGLCLCNFCHAVCSALVRAHLPFALAGRSVHSDLPMSALSLYYLIRSVDECIHSADAHRKPSNELVVCGLTEGRANLVSVLSAVTSAAMLM